MRYLSKDGKRVVEEIATRYGLSQQTVEHMLNAVSNGAGSMAQFDCPELGGSGQWMRGGMTMVGDMFNHGLKATVDNLCNELSTLLTTSELFESKAMSPGSGQWWPGNLGKPTSQGTQNNSRYAVFPNRLAVDVGGRVTVYDTLDHQIGSVSQQQGGGYSLQFSSQHGTIAVDSLPVVTRTETADATSSDRETIHTNFAERVDAKPASRVSGHAATGLRQEDAEPKLAERDKVESSGSENATDHVRSGRGESGSDILSLLEKLAQLHSAGILTDAEFSAKKAELLERL